MQYAQAHASCTTSVYVNLSKNTLLHTNRPDFWAKADAKVQNITIQTKLFNENITKLMKVFAFVDKRVFLGTKKEENFAIYDAKFSSI